MSTTSASAGLSSNRSGFSSLKRLIVMFMFSSPFLLKVNSSKSAAAGRLAAFAILSGLFHSTLCSAPLRILLRSNSTVICLKKWESRGFGGAFAARVLGLSAVASVSILSPSASSSFSYSSSSSSNSSPRILTRKLDSAFVEKSKLSVLIPLPCQTWSSTVFVTQMRIVLYRLAFLLTESTMSSLFRVMVASSLLSKSRRSL